MNNALISICFILLNLGAKSEFLPKLVYWAHWYKCAERRGVYGGN